MLLVMLMTLHAAALAAEAGEVSVADILMESDRARGNLGGVSWNVEVTAMENGRTNRVSYEVKARGRDVIAEVLAPAKSRGQKILFVKGNMWFYKPDVSKPVPVSQKQKLIGQAAYGDIATTDYANDYDASMLPDESVDGEECYLLDLKARGRKVTYDRIRYWVSKKRKTGVRAQYFTVSGKLFKSACMEFAHQVPAVNAQSRWFLSRMTIRNEVMPGDLTVIELSEPSFKDLPAHVFDLNLLVK